MRNVILLVSYIVLISIISCTEEITKKEVITFDKEIYLDSLSSADIITGDYDTTDIPLYFIPEDFTETSEKEIYSNSQGEAVEISVIMYCQTKEGIEVNYQLKSGAKFRIHYRDWAGRIIVSKGDSVVTNYSFDKKDYESLKDSSYWSDKVLSDLWISKFDSENETINALFSVASPYDLDKAEFDGIIIQAIVDSTGNVELTEAF